MQIYLHNILQIAYILQIVLTSTILTDSYVDPLQIAATLHLSDL